MSITAAKLLVLIGADTGELNRGLDDANSRFNGFADKLSRAGTRLTAAVTLPVLGVGAVAAKGLMDFDTNLNVLEATAGATGAEMDALRAKANELGADLTLPGTSAADAAEAMLELSKAGLDVKNTLAASRGVLQLSAAGQLSNAQSAEIAANALNMFKLRAEETNRVADLLAASANASSAEVKDVADSLQMAGSVAASAGMPIEDLVTMISEMANAGIQGSDAGTSLKQMLLSLQAPTDKATGMMQQLGISVYDMNGNMLPARELIGQFSSALGGLTQDQRNAALATIFGSDAVRAANIVLMGGVDAFDEMNAAVTKEGAAAELAGARMKGLGGAAEAMKSSIETALLAAVQPFQGDLENLAMKIAETANAFSELDPEMQKTLVTLPLIAAAIGPVTTGLGGLLNMAGGVAAGLGGMVGVIGKVPGFMRDAAASITLLRSGVGVLEVAQLSTAGLVVTLGAVALAVGAAVGMWAQWNAQITKTNQEGQKAVENTWKQFFQDQVAAGKDANGIMAEYVAAQGRVRGALQQGGVASLFIDQQKLARESLDELNPALLNTAQSYDDYKAKMIDAGIASGALHESYRRNVAGHEEEAGTLAYLGKQLGLVTEQQWDLQNAAYMTDDITERLSDRMLAVGDAGTVAADGIEDAASAAAEAARKIDELQGQFNELSTIISGPFGRETKSYEKNMQSIQDQIDETQRKLGELGVAEFMSPENAAAVDDLSQKLFTASNGMAQIAQDAGVAYRDLANTPSADLGSKLGLSEEQIGRITELRGESYNLIGAIQDLGGLPYATDQQKEEIDQMRGKLGELQDSLMETADAHAESMHRMAFDLISQRASSDGLTENEVNNLAEIGQAWGIYDEQTATILQTINSNIGMLDTDTPAGLLDVMNQVLDLPGEKTWDYKIEVTGLDELERLLELSSLLNGEAGLGPGVPVKYTDNGDNSTYDGRKAGGGPVYPGNIYWTGEQGPEPFIPAEAGRILSVGQAQEALRGQQPGASGGGVTIYQTNYVRDELDIELIAYRTAEIILERS